MLIKLHVRGSGEPILVNTDQIAVAFAADAGADLRLTDGSEWEVAETPDEILGMVPAFVTHTGMMDAADLMRGRISPEEFQRYRQTRAGEGRPKEPR